MKKKVVKYSLLALLIILAAFSQTLSMKADIGVCACWDSVSIVLTKLSQRVATAVIMAADKMTPIMVTIVRFLLRRRL